MEKSKCKGIFKKAIAAILGVTLTFGTLLLPNNTTGNEFSSVSAESIKTENATFWYNFSERTDHPSIKITNASFTGDTLEIPSEIEIDGTKYPVTEIGGGFLKNNKQIKTVIVPDSVTYICEHFLDSSSVEKIVLSNNIEHIGTSFANGCSNLSSVECTGTKLRATEIGSCVLYNCPKMMNEKGATCLGNWLISFKPNFAPTKIDLKEIKISDLGNDGVKIDSIGNFAIGWLDDLTTLDLEGIKCIDGSNFTNCPNLKTIINDNDVIEVNGSSFSGTPWLEEAKGNDMAKIGSVLIYYKTDDNVLDLTSGELADVRCVLEGALTDCKNLDTIFCTHDCYFGSKCFYMAHDQTTTGGSNHDSIPLIPTYNIKRTYVDGKELTYSRLWTDRDAYDWLKLNNHSLVGTALTRDMAEEKVKLVFDQLDIPYYGMNNDMIGTHTPTEEFYIRLKIHNYLSQYDYDHEIEYDNVSGAFILGGKLHCGTYAILTHYMLECAGIEADTQSGFSHYWNNTKIGDEWFESDDGWNAQNYNHSYGWFGLSTARISERDPKCHSCSGTYDSFHAYNALDLKTAPKIAERTIGDIDKDGDRDNDDAKLLWAYLKGESDSIYEKGADINFDGNIDITDAVLLENFVNSKVFEHSVVVNDGNAQQNKIAFVNGTDYDNIKYLYTDREGYIQLPADLFEAPEGKKLSYDVGKVGQTVRITNPLTVVQTKWIDASEPDYSEPDSSTPDSSTPDSSRSDSSKKDPSSKKDSSAADSSSPDKKKGILGDVNNDGTIDIEDAVAIIQHINGLTPLTADEESRADVSKDNYFDIDDAVTLISYINGNSTF